MAPQISVIIPSYNAARYVIEALESIFKQTLAPMEVVVVDDGSTDDTEEVLRPYREQIRFIKQQNSGPSAARNRGIRESRGDLIAFLDADDVWLPDKLEKQWKCLQDHPDAGLVHSNFLRWHDDTGEQVLGRKPGRERSGRCYGEMFLWNGVTPSTAMVKRECLDHVGLFDESMRACEDYELFLRIARHHEFAYVDEPLTLYRLHPSNASKGTLTMLTGELLVVHKGLRADLELSRLVGRRNVDDRLYDLLFTIGRFHHDAYRRVEARRYFLEALAHRPWQGHTLLLYMANLLPSPWARGLRRFKAGLSS